MEDRFPGEPLRRKWQKIKVFLGEASMIEKLLFGFWEILRPSEGRSFNPTGRKDEHYNTERKTDRLMLCNNFSIYLLSPEMLGIFFKTYAGKFFLWACQY